MEYVLPSNSGLGHICLIYDDEAQRRAIVAEYVATGLRRGERVRYMSDGVTSESVRAWLVEMGVELPADCEDGSLSVSLADDFYCPRGQFVPKDLIELMVPACEQVKAKGFRGMRSTAEMSWALHGIPGSERLIEYEAMLNTVHTDFPRSGMCQYDARRFDGATLFKILQVHPAMVAGGQVIRNPYYVRPEEVVGQAH